MLPDDWGDGYPNVWLGRPSRTTRSPTAATILTAIPAHVHFVSYEPAIGPLDELDLAGIEWMIVGGESGPGYRPMDLDWCHDMQRALRRGRGRVLLQAERRAPDGNGDRCPRRDRQRLPRNLGPPESSVEGQQHVDLYRKLLLRRHLLRWASDGAAYVPFIGDGDIAAQLYGERTIYGADLDPERVEVARGRLTAPDRGGRL